MVYDFTQIEKKWQHKWQTANLFETTFLRKSLIKNKLSTTFSFRKVVRLLILGVFNV